jgi:hypothetical protein
MRINKYLSFAGFASRRKADELIKEGKITINDRIAILGDEVSKKDIVKCEDTVIKRKSNDVILLFNKPKGIVCTSEKREKNNIIDYINYPVRIFNVGRLDRDSHGLILLTNMGEISNKVLKARNYHEKEYIVTVDKKITDRFLKCLREGIYLKDLETTTRPCKVWKTKDKEFHIILTQGLNRQIRRMCKECHYKVIDLFRIRIMNLDITGIKEGKYREIKEFEYNELLKILHY